MCESGQLGSESRHLETESSPFVLNPNLNPTASNPNPDSNPAGPRRQQGKSVNFCLIGSFYGTALSDGGPLSVTRTQFFLIWILTF